ncbi:MAG: DUF1697 domain-containing protein [Coriobacteriia bacterium]|nr:DUF1697 domain-containing protein [Coriobacteriia bacterium]
MALADIRIALLRGVNVGGKNSLSMIALKESFATAGYSDAKTYINSGNVLFTSMESPLILQSTIQQLLLDDFNIDTPVLVITAETLASSLAAAPEWWGKAPETRHNAMFVIAPETAESACAAVGEIKPEYEQLAYHDQLIFWSAPIKTFSRTRWSGVSRLPIYLSLTIRNHNTTRKLLQLALEIDRG